MLDRWLANIADHPERGVAGNKPADAVDSCFNVDGSLLASGRDVWDGILDDGPKGECAAAFPPFATSRIVAGGPIEGGVFKCQTQSVRARDRARSLRLVAPDRGRARPAGADLPDGGLRLQEAGRGPAARVPARSQIGRGSGRPRQAAARVPRIAELLRVR